MPVRGWDVGYGFSQAANFHFACTGHLVIERNYLSDPFGGDFRTHNPRRGLYCSFTRDCWALLIHSPRQINELLPTTSAGIEIPAAALTWS
jgi:hypothetical protein